MNNSTPSSKWFLVVKPRPQAEFRLFCFPYAGGSATAYSAWAELLPDNVELVAIQPPGRANRLGEALLTSVHDMADGVADAIGPWLDRPYMIYGHSLGSIVSFELLHSLRARGLPLPFRYFCGARRAPHVPPRIAPIHNYPLEEFKAELRTLNGTPEIILNNADLMDIFVPILRTDFKAAYNYRREPAIKLECEVSVFNGAQDDKVLEEDMLGWQAHFARKVDFRTFPGGHFFMDENRSAVLDVICASVRRRSECVAA